MRVYTIGFGTADPGANRATCGAQFVGTEPGDNGQAGGFGPGPGDPNFGGGFGNGPGGFRRAIDEDTLKAVADATGGEYYPAESAEQLEKVFAELPTDVIVSHEVVEVSVAFVALAVALLGLGIFLGQRWRPLP